VNYTGGNARASGVAVVYASPPLSPVGVTTVALASQSPSHSTKVVYASETAMYTMKKTQHQKYYNDKGLHDVTFDEVVYANYRQDTTWMRITYAITVRCDQSS
jgi:hypothetical protein